MNAGAVGVSRQLVETLLPVVVPALAGVAVFLMVWLLLRRGAVDRLFAAGDDPQRISKAAPTQREPANAIVTGAGRRDGVGRGFEPADGVRDRSAAGPLGAASRERHLAEWRQAEAQFLHDPAEAVTRAERLVSELARERGAAPVVRALVREAPSRPRAVNRATGFGGDAEFGAALGEAALGLVRLIRGGRTAGPGGTGSLVHSDRSVDDLRERMELYRRVLEQLLEPRLAEREALGAVASNALFDDARDRGSPPHRRQGATLADWAAREWPVARWHLLQLLLSLAFGFAVLILVLWVLGM